MDKWSFERCKRQILNRLSQMEHQKGEELDVPLMEKYKKLKEAIDMLCDFKDEQGKYNEVLEKFNA